MALDRMTWTPRALDRELVTAILRFEGDGAAAPIVHHASPGVSIVRDDVGAYTITVPGARILAVTHGAELAAPTADMAQITHAIGDGEVEIFAHVLALGEASPNTIAWDPFELDTGDIVSVVVYLQNTPDPS